MMTPIVGGGKLSSLKTMDIPSGNGEVSGHEIVKKE